MFASLPSTLIAPRFVGGCRIEFAERPVPEPGEGELLIRVAANVLCGSEGWQFSQGSPVTPGHEIAGEVAAVGPGASIAPGTAGVVFLIQYCGSCRSCRVSATNQCLNQHGHIGFTRDGGYQPYVAVRESSFFPTPDVRGRDGTLLLDIMGTGGHAIRRAQLVRSDIESLVVIGAGPVGLAVLAMAKLRLGSDIPVAISDFSPYRLALAERLGGVPINVSTQPLAAGLTRAGFPQPDVAFDTSGKGEALGEALNVLGQRGVLVCVGHGATFLMEITPHLITPERAVLGSEYFRFDEFEANLALLRQHRGYLDQIITHTYPQRALQEAFDLFFSHQAGKVLIEHDA